MARNVQKKAIDNIIAPIVERNIPFALVFGNHDVGGSVSKEQQMRIYKSYPGCLATEGEAMTGCGNYLLRLPDDSHNGYARHIFRNADALAEKSIISVMRRLR